MSVFQDFWQALYLCNREVSACFLLDDRAPG